MKTKQKEKEYVLVKDLVIPAGTRFSRGPAKASYGSCYYESVIGLTKDSFGTVGYHIDGDDLEHLKEYFAELK